MVPFFFFFCFFCCFCCFFCFFWFLLSFFWWTCCIYFGTVERNSFLLSRANYLLGNDHRSDWFQSVVDISSPSPVISYLIRVSSNAAVQSRRYFWHFVLLICHCDSFCHLLDNSSWSRCALFMSCMPNLAQTPPDGISCNQRPSRQPVLDFNPDLFCLFLFNIISSFPFPTRGD